MAFVAGVGCSASQYGHRAAERVAKRARTVRLSGATSGAHTAAFNSVFMREPPVTAQEAVRQFQAGRAVPRVLRECRGPQHGRLALLFLCDDCLRSIYAERALNRHLTDALSRRVLCLSAGLEVAAGAHLPLNWVRAAAERGVDLTDAQPCAQFEPSLELDMFDVVLCMDEAVRTQALTQLTGHAMRFVSGGVAGAEKRVRCIGEFCAPPRRSRGILRPLMPPVSHMERHAPQAIHAFQRVMHDIDAACLQVAEWLTTESCLQDTGK